MVVDFSLSGGLVFGIVHTDEALMETAEGEFEFCSAIVFHLGFVNMAILFV